MTLSGVTTFDVLIFVKAEVQNHRDGSFYFSSTLPFVALELGEKNKRRWYILDEAWSEKPRYIRVARNVGGPASDGASHWPLVVARLSFKFTSC